MEVHWIKAIIAGAMMLAIIANLLALWANLRARSALRKAESELATGNE